MEDVIRYRLCMSELIPVEMSQHRICMEIAYFSSFVYLRPKHTANGRVYFKVPNLFEVSLCLQGARKADGWIFLHVEFLITIGGDLTGMEGECSMHVFIAGEYSHRKTRISSRADWLH